MTYLSKLAASVSSLSLIFVICLSANPASAAITSASVTPANPTPGATSNLDISLSGYQTSTPVKCISTKFAGGYLASSTLFDFESGAQGWPAGTAPVTVAPSTAYAHGGTQSLSVATTTTGSPGVQPGVTLSAPYDKSALGDEISAWVYVPVGAATGAYASILTKNGAYTNYNSGGFPVTPGSWTKIYLTLPSWLTTDFHYLNFQVNFSGATGSAIAYIDDVQMGPSASNSVDGDKPNGLNFGSSDVTGSFVGNNNFSRANGADSNVQIFSRSAGYTPTGSSATLTIPNVVQPSAANGQSVFLIVTTYSGDISSGACTGTVLDGPFTVVYATTPAVSITATVDPILSFTVAALVGSSCNGATSTGSSNGTTISMGRATAGTNVVAGQKLSIGTNANGGYKVSVRSSGAIADGRGNSINNFAATNASPAAFSAPGTANFGYTTDHILSGAATRFQTNKWAGLSSADAEVIYGSTVTAADSANVCYQLGVSALTPAATYSATVIYSAVPSF